MEIEHRPEIGLAPPRQPGVCDECGGALEQRADDSEEVVRNRLAVYQEQTQPLVDYYRARGVLTTVPGVGEPDEVFRSLMNCLGKEVA